MIRLAITVEGETEEDFINEVLAPHLNSKDIFPFPILLGRVDRKVGGGGNVTIGRLAADVASNYHRFDFVTSLVDYYGFKDKGTRNVVELEKTITEEVDRRLRPNWDSRKVIPYVQLHEFEGLLFSQVSGFLNVPGADQEAIRQLESIRGQFPSPEEINDDPNTAPSKRILEVLPDYIKRTDGPLVAQSIGLTTIRRECPRFNCWLTRLESLST